ncbi:DNA-binding protein [Bacteroidia bacterium]|nr:DNA-binding protein [Bacteroidia bacterium]
MDILDRKSEAIHFFFTGLEEILEVIGAALKNRTPHLNGEKFLTGKDVCGMLHISPRTLQEWRTQGKIPFLRLKGKILYKESEVLKWLGNNYLPPVE